MLLRDLARPLLACTGADRAMEAPQNWFEEAKGPSEPHEGIYRIEAGLRFERRANAAVADLKIPWRSVPHSWRVIWLKSPLAQALL